MPLPRTEFKSGNWYARVIYKGRKRYFVAASERVVPQRFSCPCCGKTFELSGESLKSRISNVKRRGSSGPYCSRSCAGKHTRFGRPNTGQALLSLQGKNKTANAPVAQ